MVGLGLVAGSIIVVLRQQRPELALLLSLAAGAVIFFGMLSRILAVVETLQTLGERARVESAYMGTVLKIIGIAYLADFGSQVLADAGEKAVATKVEMAGKVLILILALPVLMTILDTLLQMLA